MTIRQMVVPVQLASLIGHSASFWARLSQGLSLWWAGCGVVMALLILPSACRYEDSEDV